jgi:hypothetical protein
VVDIIGIEEAQSMCEAYNAWMNSSDAKYKVYLHQDVFIREHNFILYLLERFRKDESIGMIGIIVDAVDGLLMATQYDVEWQDLSDILAAEIRDRIDCGDWESAAQMISSYRRNRL